MTTVSAVPDVSSWDNPPHLDPRGTIVLIPGRGEDPRLYERLGARLGADAYRVRVVADPTRHQELTVRQIEQIVTADDPSHPLVLAGSDSGALFAALPPDCFDRADLSAVPVPVPALHGAGDGISPLAEARTQYAAAPRIELVSLSGGRHDALNDAGHRTSAATVPLFLERLRLGADAPASIAVREEFPS